MRGLQVAFKQHKTGMVAERQVWELVTILITDMEIFKKYMCVCMLYLMAAGVHAQQRYDHISSVGLSAPIYRSEVAQKYPFDMEGTVYAYSDEFETGSVVYNGKEYFGVLLNLNSHRDELQLKVREGEVILSLKKTLVSRFAMGEREFVNISGENAVITATPKLGYMIDKVILNGEDVTFAFDVYNGGAYTVNDVAENVVFAVICKEVEMNEEKGITTTDVATLQSVFVPAKGNGHSVGAITFGKIKKDVSNVKSYGIEIKDEDGADIKTKSGKGPRFKAEKSNGNGQYAIEFNGLPAGKYKSRTYIEYTDGSIKYGAYTKFEIK